MGVVARIVSLVTLFFVLLMAISFFFVLRQAQTDIRREQQAAAHLIDALLEYGADRPQQLMRLVEKNLRHIGVGGQPPAPVGASQSSAPPFFTRLLAVEDQGFSARYLVVGGETLTLYPDAGDEIDEVWDSSIKLFWVFVISALLSNLAIVAGVRYSLRPLGHLLAAIEQFEGGSYRARLPAYSVPELNGLAVHFNQMGESLQRAEQENRFLTRALLDVQERERAQLARELHDDLGQHLTGIRTQAYLLELSQPQGEALTRISRLISESCAAVDVGFRRLIQDLYPLMLEQLGLGLAVTEMAKQFEQRTAIGCRLAIDQPIAMEIERATHLYRLIQEALNNVARHAEATSVAIELWVEDADAPGRVHNPVARHAEASSVAIELRNEEGPDSHGKQPPPDGATACSTPRGRAGRRLQLLIADNGIGLPELIAMGMGLRSMRERGRLLGGALQFAESTGGGCRLSLTVPLTAPDTEG